METLAGLSMVVAGVAAGIFSLRYAKKNPRNLFAIAIAPPLCAIAALIGLIRLWFIIFG